MKHEKEEILKFILSQNEIEMPQLQEDFSLSYSEAKTIVNELLQEGAIKYKSGITYEVLRQEAQEPSAPPVYVPQSEEEKFFLKALWECVKLGCASLQFIQRRCCCSYGRAIKVMEWMEAEGYVPVVRGIQPREVRMSQEEYCKKYGVPTETGAPPSIRNFTKPVEDKRRTLYEWLGETEDEDDEDEDVEDFDEDDEDDDDDDSDWAKAYKEHLLAELESGNSDGGDLKTYLIECLKKGLQKESESGMHVLGLNNGLQFDFQFVKDGDVLKLSDGGKTLAGSTQTKRKIRNVLKEYSPVVLDGEEISVLIINPFDTLMALLKLYAAVEAVKKMK